MRGTREKLVVGCVAALVVLAACGSATNGGGDGGLVQSMLDRTPIPEDTSASSEFWVLDLAAIAEASDVDRVGDPASWAVPLLIGAPIQDGGTGFAPAFIALTQDAIGFHDEWSDETGFSLNDIDQIAEMRSDIERFDTVVGPSDWAQDAPEIASGVRTIGTGDDYEHDLGSRSTLRMLGRPLRVAASDGVLAASLSSSAIEVWLSGNASVLGDDQRYAAAAAELDRAGVVSAVIFDYDFRGADGVVDVSFGVIGIGQALRAGAATEIVVYVFADDNDASAAADDLAAGWTSGSLISNPELQYSDRYSSVDVTTSGRTVVVTLEVPADGIAGAVSFLFQREPVFSYR